MFQIRAKLIYNKRVKDNYFHMGLQAPVITKEAQPGQFVNIRISDNGEPLLRRPFSIHRVSRMSEVAGHRSKACDLRGETCDQIVIFYEVLGKGTQILSRKKAGEYLDLIGPLGNGFNYRTTDDGRRTTVLVAGGMGVAPLIFLAEKLVRRSPVKTGSRLCREKFKVQRKPLVFLGARTKKQILCDEEFRKLGCEVKIATDDGSKGFAGKVTDLLKEYLPTTNDQRPTTIYACGPRPMLKEISRISQEYNIPAQISLEEHMACGIGACLGCVVKTQYAQGNRQSKFQYQRVCKEGPVFDSGQISW